MISRLMLPRSIFLSMIPTLAVILCGQAPVRGQSYTPEHPQVRAMVEKGVKYLSGLTATSSSEGYGAGENILVGYAILKETGNVDHPKVKIGITAARNIANTANGKRHPAEGKIVYEAGIAAVMLATADAGRYSSELQQLLSFFQTIQKPHGGFGYIGKATGDTSQVQYIMLALWTMNEAGMDVPFDMVESTVRYIRGTMDPSGGWGYQGNLGQGRLVQQSGVTKSLATAGLGALIIGGDVLGFYGQRKLKDDDDDIPEAFVRIDLLAKLRRERREVTMSRSDTDGAIATGIRFQNNSKFTGAYWYFYWRYSQERYEAFREIYEGKQNKSPDWYNEGVRELAQIQQDDGSFGGKAKSDLTPDSINTAFAVLFLIRSTQKAIGKLDEGLTYGGYELPNDLTNIKMVGEKIVSDEDASVENLLSMLEDDEAGDVQVSLLPEHMPLSNDATQRREQVARLSRLLVSGEYQARRVAAKLLGRTEDISVVPDLIYALTDSDPHVPMIAEESLRLLSRKLTAGKLATGAEDSERKAAEKYWKAWYLGLRPDYIFIDR